MARLRVREWTTRTYISRRRIIVEQGYPIYDLQPYEYKPPKKIKRGTNGRKANKRRRFPSKRKRVYDQQKSE